MKGTALSPTKAAGVRNTPRDLRSVLKKEVHITHTSDTVCHLLTLGISRQSDLKQWGIMDGRTFFVSAVAGYSLSIRSFLQYSIWHESLSYPRLK